MFKNLLFVLIVVLSSLTFSCSYKMDAGNIDLVNWKNDRYGCKGLRIRDLEEFRRIKNEFLGKDNQALIKTFGRPDRVELIDKSQTFFFYFLEPSEQCEGVIEENEPLKVLFRLNAISRISEVTITNLNP